MSIALVGTPTTTSQTSALTIIVNVPTGHAATHVGYCWLTAAASGGMTATGWTLIATGATDGNGGAIFLMRRVFDGTEGASVTFSNSVAVRMGNMRLYSGVNNATPEDTAAANPQSAVGTTGQPSVSGFTTLQNGDMLVFACGTLSGPGTYTAPSGYGNASNISDAGNTEKFGTFDEAQASAGATGSVTAGGGTAGDVWDAMLLAIQPAVGGSLPLPLYARRHLHLRLVPVKPLRRHTLRVLPAFPSIFPPGLRHRQQPRRVSRTRAKRPLRSHLNPLLIPPRPFPEFPVELRHQRQKKRIPLVKAKRRVYGTELYIPQAPAATFPAPLRRAQQRRRLVRVRPLRPARSSIELRIPQAGAAVQVTRPDYIWHSRRRTRSDRTDF